MIKPPRAIDYPERPLDCEDAPLVRDVADRALQMGWAHEEIASAIMEIANTWYLAQIENARTRDKIDLALAKRVKK
jgi:hypothetical protein